MSRGRRSQVVTEADRRAREQRARLGGEVRASRLRRHWTQQHLAELAGVDRQIVGRIERATTRLDVDVLQRIGVALTGTSTFDSGVTRWSIPRTRVISRCRS